MLHYVPPVVDVPFNSAAVELGVVDRVLPIDLIPHALQTAADKLSIQPAAKNPSLLNRTQAIQLTAVSDFMRRHLVDLFDTMLALPAVSALQCEPRSRTNA